GRIPVAARRVASAQLIGLQLVAAAVLQEEHAQALFRQAAELLRAGDEDAERHQAYGAADRSRVLLRRVPRGDVPGFMPEHPGQLRFVVEKREDAARDVD